MPKDRQSRSTDLRDYYIAPTHDFTQYTKDYEERYWSKETAFDWEQDVGANLKAHVENLSPTEFDRLAPLSLPLVERAVVRHLSTIRDSGLPLDDDALKDIAETLPSDRAAIQRAIALEAPLGRLQLPVARGRDGLAILEWEAADLREQRRLGLFRNTAGLRRLETEAERLEQAARLAQLEVAIDQARDDLEKATSLCAAEGPRLRIAIQQQLQALAPEIMADLEATLELVRNGRQSIPPRSDSHRTAQLRDLVWKRQVRALKDIANHALVVEQSAIAPLSMGVILYKRRREIQEAMTTFVNDEAKHTAVFRRFLAQKLEAKERVSKALVKSGDRYLWLARFLPSGAVFLAVIIEAIGGAFLEFFGNASHMPEPLFCSICSTIAERDETRHSNLCAATYNELYRRGGRWEQWRNRVALKTVLRASYGDKTEDHQLLQACRAFGYHSDRLYEFIAMRLSEQLTKIGTFVPPESFLRIMGAGSETAR